MVSSARKILRRSPQVKRQLWGGEFWTDGYFASTVGKHGDESKIARYVKAQGLEYDQLYKNNRECSINCVKQEKMIK